MARRDVRDVHGSARTFSARIQALLIAGGLAITVSDLKAQASPFQLYNACRPMQVETRVWGDSDSLNRDAIQASAEILLRTHSLYSVEPDAAAFAQLVVEVGVVGRVAAVEARYWKPFATPEWLVPDYPGEARSWNLASAYRRQALLDGAQRERILSTLDELLTVFVADYLRVNDDACEAVERSRTANRLLGHGPLLASGVHTVELRQRGHDRALALRPEGTLGQRPWGHEPAHATLNGADW